MKAWIKLVLAALLHLIQAAPAQAQTLPHIFSNPRVLPGPQVPESLVLRFSWTGCGSWTSETLNVSVSGNVVTVRQTLTWSNSQCIVASGVQFSLGTFPPGSYTLVYQAEEFFTGIGTYPALTTQFTVGGGVTPAAVSAISWPSAAALVAGLLMIGLLARARRRQSC